MKWYISKLELLAVKLAFQTFLKSQEFTLALTYLEKMGGTKNQNKITVEYLPSSLNKVVGLKSRLKVNLSKWVLCLHVFRNHCLKLRTPTADLVAVRVSHQVAQYVECQFLLLRIQASLIPLVLSKILQDQLNIVTMITPCWQT